jgi:hypothetical protein
MKKSSPDGDRTHDFKITANSSPTEELVTVSRSAYLSYQASPGDLAANVADMSPTCDAVTHFGSDMRVVGTQISSVGT